MFLTAEPERRLRGFGKTATLDEEQIRVAEEYLLDVLSAANAQMELKHFMSLEYRLQVQKQNGSALDLPPTSYSIRNRMGT